MSRRSKRRRVDYSALAAQLDEEAAGASASATATATAEPGLGALLGAFDQEEEEGDASFDEGDAEDDDDEEEEEEAAAAKEGAVKAAAPAAAAATSARTSARKAKKQKRRTASWRDQLYFWKGTLRQFKPHCPGGGESPSPLPMAWVGCWVGSYDTAAHATWVTAGGDFAAPPLPSLARPSAAEYEASGNAFTVEGPSQLAKQWVPDRESAWNGSYRMDNGDGFASFEDPMYPLMVSSETYRHSYALTASSASAAADDHEHDVQIVGGAGSNEFGQFIIAGTRAQVPRHRRREDIHSGQGAIHLADTHRGIIDVARRYVADDDERAKWSAAQVVAAVRAAGGVRDGGIDAVLRLG